MFRVSLQNELFKLAARRRTWVGFAAYLAIEVILLGLLTLPRAQQKFGELLAKNGIDFAAAWSAPTLATYTIYLTVGLLGGLYLALVAADLVAKEVEDGTMRMILARPVTRVQVLAGKVVASVVHTFGFVGFIGASSLVAAAIYSGGLGDLLVFAPTQEVFAFHEGGEALWRYARAVFFLSLASQTVSALGLLFSCLPLRPATATILTLSVLMTDLALSSTPFFRPYQSWFVTHHLGCWLLTFQYVVPWTRIAESLIYLGALSASCWIVGTMVFAERDLR